MSIMTTTGKNIAKAFGTLLIMTVSKKEPRMRLSFGSRARRTEANPIIRSSRRKVWLGAKGYPETVIMDSTERSTVNIVFIRKSEDDWRTLFMHRLPS